MDCYISLLSEIKNQFVELNPQDSEIVYHVWNQDHNIISERLVIFSRCNLLGNNGDIKFGKNVQVSVKF